MRVGKLGILHHWALGKLNSMGSWCTELSNYMGGWGRRKLNSMGGWVKKKVPSSPPQVFFSGIALNSLCPSQQFFNLVGTGLPGLNQY